MSKNTDHELEKLWDEVENYYSLTDEGFEWIDVFGDIQEDLQLFILNMNSLSLTFNTIDKSNDDNSFLIGTLWSGVLGSYEGFIHNLFDRLLQKTSFLQLAINNISNLPEKDKQRLRIKSNQEITKQYLESLFRKATLHDPNYTAWLMNQLFGITIPEIDEDEVKYSLNVRNAYTHNNGCIDNEKIEIPLSSLKEFHKEIDLKISHFVNDLLVKSNNFMEDNK